MSDTEPLTPSESHSPKLGISLAAFIIVSETAGSGILALPQAMVSTGYWGVALIVCLGAMMVYNGYCLGASYTNILPNSEEDTSLTRDPFPLIAERAGQTISENQGKYLRSLTIISMVVMNYGSAVVFLILISQYAHDLMAQYFPGVPLSFCSWIVMTGGLVIPTTWLGSPKDLGFISLGSVLVTIVASILVVVQIIIDYQNGYHGGGECPSVNKSFFEKVVDVVQSYSTIMFSYAGASIYPSIQTDMKNKANFKFAALLSIGIILSMYLPVALVGYGLIGNCVSPNVILSLSPGFRKALAEILLILHLYTAITIFINPVNLYFEYLLQIPTELNWKRIAFRSSVMMLMTFLGLSLPEFSNLLDLIGSGPSALLNFILPPAFYILLIRTRRNISLWEKVLCGFIAFSGLFMGFFGLGIALKNISYTHFALPCYLNASSWSH